MTSKYPAKHEDLDKNVTLGTLLEYTDEFLIPKMGEMMDEKIGGLERKMDEKIGGLERKMDEKIGKLRSDLIDHVERTVSVATGKLRGEIIKTREDIIAAMNKRHEQYRLAFEKIMAILQRSNLVAVEEVKAVYELIA